MAAIMRSCGVWPLTTRSSRIWNMETRRKSVARKRESPFKWEHRLCFLAFRSAGCSSVCTISSSIRRVGV
eukprot:3772994-Rhodomonas_salina.1